MDFGNKMLLISEKTDFEGLTNSSPKRQSRGKLNGSKKISTVVLDINNNDLMDVVPQSSQKKARPLPLRVSQINQAALKNDL